MSNDEHKIALVKELIENSISLGGGEGDEMLFAELGRRAKLLETEPRLAGQIDMPIEAPLEGVGDFFGELGQRLFRRIHRELYELFCGSNLDDSRDREKLKEAFGLGEDALIAALVATMISSFGIAPVLATVIAAILLKRLLRPAYEETCSLWKEYLET